MFFLSLITQSCLFLLPTNVVLSSDSKELTMPSGTFGKVAPTVEGKTVDSVSLLHLKS